MNESSLTPEQPLYPKRLNKTKLMLVRFKRKLLAQHIYLLRFLLIVIALIFVGGCFYGGFIILQKTGISHSLSLAKNFVFPSEREVQVIDGRTNILVLGKAGEGTVSPDLTDTIMLVSINHTNNHITMVSFPRDIWVPALKAKLNSAYYWGNQKQENGGLILVKSTVEEIAGVPIHYGVVIDFAGFTRLIDVVGGIDVEVERDFVDERYPLAGKENDECGGDPEYLCRYETIAFTKGTHHMDGTTALKFVRSRHSKDLTEGTDLARAARQQQVLKALKKEIVSSSFLLSLGRMRAFYEAGWAMLETDIPDTDLAVLARWSYNSKDSLESYVVPEDLLVNPPILSKYDRQYVFIPKGEDWEEIHKWVASVL